MVAASVLDRVRPDQRVIGEERFGTVVSVLPHGSPDGGGGTWIVTLALTGETCRRGAAAGFGKTPARSCRFPP